MKLGSGIMEDVKGALEFDTKPPFQALQIFKILPVPKLHFKKSSAVSKRISSSNSEDFSSYIVMF